MTMTTHERLPSPRSPAETQIVRLDFRRFSCRFLCVYNVRGGGEGPVRNGVRCTCRTHMTAIPSDRLLSVLYIIIIHYRFYVVMRYQYRDTILCINVCTEPSRLHRNRHDNFPIYLYTRAISVVSASRKKIIYMFQVY